MEFRRLGSAREPLFAEAFALYTASFPAHEQRLLDQQTALMPNPLYHFDVLEEDGSLAGLLLHWEGSGYEYVEHFAIHPARRGRNIGSRALAEFCENSVILEIDPPVTETAARRERFYQRLGFKTNSFAHLHPAYQERFPPHELVVMSYPRPLTEREYRRFQRELAEIVMKDAAGLNAPR